MLSNLTFIRRGGKRKARKGKANDQSSSSDPSSKVLNIGDPSLDLDDSVSSTSMTNLLLRSPLVHLNLPAESEEWFPRELLQGRDNARVSLVDSRRTATPTPDNLTLETGQHSLSSSSSEQTPPAEDVPFGLHARKKSIPAPIIIPDVDHLLPNFQLSSAPPAKTASQTDETAVNPPPSLSSDNLSAVSGTTLARALISNSFVLSSVEHRKSRHRSGMARQDSATLPRGENILNFSPQSRDKQTSGAELTGSSDSGRPLSVPPVPPLPPVPIGPFLHPKYTPGLTSGLTSGSSTSSEYPISDAYATSPEVTSHAGRRISRTQEVPSPTPSTPSMSATPPPRRITGFSANDSPHTHKSSTSDVPNTASDMSSPLDSQPRPQESPQAESFLLSSDHTLDEFDFVPLGPQSMSSPGSDTSASYIAPRRDFSGRQKRRKGGPNNVTSTDDVATDATLVSPHGDAINMIASAASEQDFGELLNYPLTVSPEVTPSYTMSSVSAGYQTFPETPALFTPLVSAGFSGFRSDSQWSRPSRAATGRGPGKLSHHGTLNRHIGKKNDNLSSLQKSRPVTSLLPIQRTPPSPKPERPSTSPSPQPSQKATMVEETPLPTTGTTMVEASEEPQEAEETEMETGGMGETARTDEIDEVDETEETKPRPHPLAHISSSSSKLQAEEALQAFARQSRSSLPSMMMGPDNASSSSRESPHLMPLPDSGTASPVSPPVTESVMSTPSLLLTSAGTISHPQPKSHLATAESSILGSSFLPSPSPSPSPLASLREPHSRTTSPVPQMPTSRASSYNLSPSYIAPPPYHVVVSERTPYHPLSASLESQPRLSRAPSVDPAYERIREASTSTAPDTSSHARVRSRPPLPGGPRKPSGITQQPLVSLVPGPINRNGSVTSVATHEHGSSPTRSPWPKLYAAASKSPPKFHTPAPKWRGLTMEAAQWTFTSDELQSIVSRAIQSSSEGSSIRLLRLETLEGEIADETHRLEMQHTDVKAQYKALVRKRWTLMGALAGHIEGVEMNDTVTAIQTTEELAEVSLALDHLAEKLHDIIEQLAQLRSLREVHNESALSMALRKMHRSFVKQTAEKDQLMERVDNLQSERDEAWKHAEEVAKECDKLNNRLLETTRGGEVQPPVNDDAVSFQSNRRSAHLSALRKSSIRQSQAGLRSRSKARSRRSSFSGASTSAGPSAPSTEDVPPVPPVPPVPRVPPLPLNPRMSTMLTTALSTGGPLSTASFYSSESARDSADLWAFAQAQREVYEMLGMSVPSSQASSRPRTISSPRNLRRASRPVSDSGAGTGHPVVKPREKGRRTIQSVNMDDR